MVTLQLAEGGVLCIVATEVEGEDVESEEEGKVGEDVLERCVYDGARVRCTGLTDDRWGFIVEKRVSVEWHSQYRPYFYVTGFHEVNGGNRIWRG